MCELKKVIENIVNKHFSMWCGGIKGLCRVYIICLSEAPHHWHKIYLNVSNIDIIILLLNNISSNTIVYHDGPTPANAAVVAVVGNVSFVMFSNLLK